MSIPKPQAEPLVAPPSTVPAVRPPGHSQLAVMTKAFALIDASGSLVLRSFGSSSNAMPAVQGPFSGVYAAGESRFAPLESGGWRCDTPSGERAGGEAVLPNTVTGYDTGHVTFASSASTLCTVEPDGSVRVSEVPVGSASLVAAGGRFLALSDRRVLSLPNFSVEVKECAPAGAVVSSVSELSDGSALVLYAEEEDGRTVTRGRVYGKGGEMSFDFYGADVTSFFEDYEVRQLGEKTSYCWQGKTVWL